MRKIVDISHHQKKVDFELLKPHGISGAIIRAGYSTTLDSCFEYNVSECQRLGIPYGLYWYSYAVTEEECKKEAEAFVNAVRKVKADRVPLFLDMEDADGKKAKKAEQIGRKWNDDMIYNRTSDFLTDLCYRALSHEIGLYASQSYYIPLDKKENQSICADIDIIRWVARWSSEAPKVMCDIWQYTNSYKWAGAESGIVDMSYITEQMFHQLFKRDDESVERPDETIGSTKVLKDYTVKEMIDEIMTR